MNKFFIWIASRHLGNIFGLFLSENLFKNVIALLSLLWFFFFYLLFLLFLSRRTYLLLLRFIFLIFLLFLSLALSLCNCNFFWLRLFCFFSLFLIFFGVSFLGLFFRNGLSCCLLNFLEFPWFLFFWEFNCSVIGSLLCAFPRYRWSY